MRRARTVIVLFSLLLVATLVMAGTSDLGQKGTNEPTEGKDGSTQPDMTPLSGASPPLPAQIRLWEAWAKGYATVEQNDFGEYTVYNNGPVDIILDEYIMVMSPSPSNPSEDVPGIDDETQDGILTTLYTVSPGSSLTYYYGLDVAYGAQPPPPGGVQRIPS